MSYREDLDGYVQRFSKSRQISEQEARSYQCVQQYAKYLRERGNDECQVNQPKKTTINAACGVDES